MAVQVQTGLEVCLTELPAMLNRQRLGLLCNQASTDRNLRHARDLILAAFPGQLTCLFSPQHGFFSARQDNMVESDHMTDPVSGLPVYSLYGETRKPYPEMFASIDSLLIDLIDVGTRVYTFVWTVILCLETAAETGTRVVVLDRPNPLGGRIEGNLLEENCASFVGLWPIPMRHGLTIGELALLCNREMDIGADLHVIPARGWRRDMLFSDTGLPWVFPSPNMPDPVTAMVYPGQVIWEGTNVSEGRGTTLPFELFGAPFLDPGKLVHHMDKDDLAGCLLRPLAFEPTSGKWAGENCQGFQLHVTDEDRFRPYRTSLALLQAIMTLYPDQFAYKKPPYEYEYKQLPMDLILGSRQVRQNLEQGVAIADMEASWQNGLAEYQNRCRSVFLYE